MTDFPATAHHVGLTVTDPEVSRQWYQRLLNAAPVLDQDFPAVPEHHQGFHKVVFALPGGLVLGLIAHPATDPSQRFNEFGPGLDHISFRCADRSELEKWQHHLDELGITHGGIAEDAFGFALAFRDPDNIALEFWAPRS
jgi:catechol 2,3-dioxygenase-like lactoylglutathione lyase family enzyme